MDTARRLNLVLLVALLAAGCGCAVFDRTPDPQPVAEAFASDLRNGRIDGADLVHPGDADAAVEMLADVTDELTTSPSVGVIGPVEVIESTSVDGTGTRALAHLRISWETADRDVGVRRTTPVAPRRQWMEGRLEPYHRAPAAR